MTHPVIKNIESPEMRQLGVKHEHLLSMYKEGNLTQVAINSMLVDASRIMGLTTGEDHHISATMWEHWKGVSKAVFHE
jgi:hypothetical protein